jgi:crotonobetainyl-CoA:carnitine CoA-transferase CaiB-like acyl-CoA transferase
MGCYGVYPCADGKYLSLGALEPKFYQAFNDVIGRATDFADLLIEPARQERVRAEIAARLATKTRAEWLALFAGKDVCCEPILELDEVADHTLHVARRMFFTVDDPHVGKVRQMRTPVGQPEARRLAPKLGEHTDEVLGEHGFSPEEIAHLRGNKAIA